MVELKRRDFSVAFPTQVEESFAGLRAVDTLVVFEPVVNFLEVD